MKKRYESFEEIEQDIREGRLVDGLEENNMVSKGEIYDGSIHMGGFDDKTLDMLKVQEEYEKACVTEDRNKKIDPTNPDHYKNSTSLECIEAMEIIFGKAAVLDFCACNAWKYIWRWKNKNGAEDLKKAKWYIEKAWELIDGVVTPAGIANLLTRMNDYVNKWIKETEE